MDRMDRKITIITPTTGKSSLFKLIDSIKLQEVNYTHLILWDDKRDSDINPFSLEYDGNNICNSIVIKGNLVQGQAYGSALRSVGLLAAITPFVTFADDDVFWDKNHLENILDVIDNNEWAYCRRKIWYNDEYIGVDNFESVGDDDRKVPYEMVDNNCMIFKRELGVIGAAIYRSTSDYNDDRLFYSFLKQYGGTCGKTKEATVNQVCPERLKEMFKTYCTKGI